MATNFENTDLMALETHYGAEGFYDWLLEHDLFFGTRPTSCGPSPDTRTWSMSEAPELFCSGKASSSSSTPKSGPTRP